MSGQTVLSVRELGDTYGVIFTGYVMGMMFYGFTLFQTYVYYSQYPLDNRVIKATVGSLWALDTINFGLISHTVYRYLISTYPDVPPLLDFTATYCAEIGVSVLVIFVVQIYYSHRVWIASQNAAIAAGIVVISFAAFAFGIAITGIIAKNLRFSFLATPQGKGIMASSQGLTFLSGIATFVALSIYSPPQNSGVESAQKFYNLFVAYAITRCWAATTIQFASFVTFLLAPTKFFWMPLHLILSKVFINSLLAVLNGREVHQGQRVNGDISGRKTDTSSSSSAPRLNSNIRFAAPESKPAVNIQVRTNTTTRLVLDENEADEWDRKGTGSKQL